MLNPPRGFRITVTAHAGSSELRIDSRPIGKNRGPFQVLKQYSMGTIFCAGGNERGVADNTAEYFDWTSESWRSTAPMRRRRSDFGLVSVHGKVLAIGGWTDFGKRLSSVEIYDPSKDRWRPCSSMRLSRSQVTACQCHCDGAIYAVGGEGRGGTARRCAERYDARANRWTKVAKMNDRRWSACSCSRREDGCVYVLGGYDESSGGALATCERYDPRSGEWTRIAQMGQKRCGGAAGVLSDGNIYVMGGTNERMAPLATVERYDSRMDRWECLPSMKYPRNFFGVAPVDNDRFLYAIGGGADSVEIYDSRTSTWSVSESRLGRKRNRHGVVWCDWTWDPTSSSCTDLPGGESPNTSRSDYGSLESGGGGGEKSEEKEEEAASDESESSLRL